MDSGNSLHSAEFGGIQGDVISEELTAAWKADPRCAQCGEPVRSVLDAALLVGSNRVAHKERCYIPALIRGNPHLKLFMARPGAQEGSTGGDVPPGSAPQRWPGTRNSNAAEADHG